MVYKVGDVYSTGVTSVGAFKDKADVGVHKLRSWHELQY